MDTPLKTICKRCQKTVTWKTAIQVAKDGFIHLGCATRPERKHAQEKWLEDYRKEEENE